MAEEQEFNISLEPTIYFYVNKDNGEVEYVSMYTLFGNTVRAKGEKWTMGTRDMLAKYYSPDYEIWSYDWSNEDDTPGSGGSADPGDDDSWEIELVQEWAKGNDLNRADLEDTCKLVNSGEYMSAEEAEKIPGE
jgi:hypothetical protein